VYHIYSIFDGPYSVIMKIDVRCFQKVSASLSEFLISRSDNKVKTILMRKIQTN
jgi:hypothetical protein